MRLTFTRADGTWVISGVDWEKVPRELYGALHKLKDYEEVCESVDALRQVSGLFLEKCEEVNRMELELNKRPLPYSRPEHCLDCPCLNQEDDCVLQSQEANAAAGESWEALMDGCPLQGTEDNRWIPLPNVPETNDYILLSFENYSVPLVGRYEKDKDGGKFYLGDYDGEDTCLSQELSVNAWQPLPEAYRGE